MIFTPRDIEMVTYLAEGMDTQEIATAMKHTWSTAQTYRTRLLKKHHARSAAHLVSIAYKRGILTIKP